MEQRLDAMLHAVQTVQPALAKFYASLNDEQKRFLFPSELETRWPSGALQLEQIPVIWARSRHV
jgi:hypothetical protein